MTVDELIQTVLREVWADFYAPRTREFHRDKIAILKAIMRFGYHCDQNGWQLDAGFVTNEILAVLRSMRDRRAAIEYLPAYLDGALKRAIGLRAEELSAESKRIGNLVTRTTAGLKTQSESKRNGNDVPAMAAIFKRINKPKKKRQKKPVQQELLYE